MTTAPGQHRSGTALLGSGAAQGLAEGGHHRGAALAGLVAQPGEDREPVELDGGGEFVQVAKEQWAPALTALRRFGMAGIVTEMPGVGENTLRYDRESWRMFGAIADAVSDWAEVAQIYAMTLSFSGHLALRWAAEDSRVRGVVTVGPPIRHFFTDRPWLAALPNVTLDTLAHLAGVSGPELPELVADWPLPPTALAGLDIPVACTASLRDEIIPPADVRVMRAEISRLWLVENDDVHGSPHHVVDTRLWAMRSILRMYGHRRLPAGLLGAVLGMRRTRRRFATGRR